MNRRVAPFAGSFLSPTLCLAVALGACQPRAEAPSEAARAPEDRAPAAPVALVVAQAQNVSAWTAVTGTLIAEQRSQLSANAAGRVEATRVERGQSVEAGDVLVVLDARAAKHGAIEAKANLRNLQAQRATGTRDCQRYEALYKKQAISDQEYQRMMAQCRELDAQFEAAEARLANAVRTLSDGTVRAPFAGVVSERMVQVGDYLQPSSPVVTLLKPDPLRVRCAVPESQAAFVTAGNRVAFSVAAYAGRSFDAHVKFVSSEVREASRDIVFEAEVPNEDHVLLPGMFVTGRLYAGEQPAVVVPKASVLTEAGHTFVFRVRDNRLEKHQVRLGEAVDDEPKGVARVAIHEGLGGGEQVAARASADLVDGQPTGRD